jgi:hypothetical protein
MVQSEGWLIPEIHTTMLALGRSYPCGENADEEPALAGERKD